MQKETKNKENKERDRVAAHKSTEMSLVSEKLESGDSNRLVK